MDAEPLCINSDVMLLLCVLCLMIVDYFARENRPEGVHVRLLAKATKLRLPAFSPQSRLWDTYTHTHTIKRATKFAFCA